MSDLIISTPLYQLKNDYSQTSRLSWLRVDGNTNSRIITLEANSNIITNINLSQGGVGSAFYLGPSASAISMNSGQKTSLLLNYDSSKGTGLTASFSIECNGTGAGGPINNESLVIGPSGSNTLSFEVYNPESFSRRDIAPLLNVNKNNEHTLSQSLSKITQDETSFGVIRTNPKLTGNVKITIDSNQDIWLNSIDAVKELSDDKYKKFRISPYSSYVSDINTFFNSGKTPAEIVFALYEDDPNYLTTKRTFDKQFDRYYQYGVSQLKNKFYTEDFSLFAPLYLKEEVPEYFVIFKTSGPVNEFTYTSDSKDWHTFLTSDILSKTSIVKTYDLGEKSPIGRYLRNIINHPARRPSDITVSFQESGYTTFNGISYTNGTFAQMGERLKSYYDEENPLSVSEEFITLGFQRNKVLSSHLLNLEFLFSDEDAKEYSINRYFGFYVNSIDLAKFNLSQEGFEKFSLQIGQTPLPRKGVDATKVSQKSFVQTNENGIKLFIETSGIENKPYLDPLVFSSICTIQNINSSTFEIIIKGNFLDKLQNGETVYLSDNSVNASCQILEVSYNNIETKLLIDINTYEGDIPVLGFSILKDINIDFYSETKYNNYKKRIFDNSFIENTPRFFYIKDNKNLLYSVKSTENDIVSLDPFTTEEVIKLSLLNRTVDLSNFSGFSNLLTQTDAKLLQKGRSSLSIKVLDYFNVNDYLEIKWTNGPTSDGYPLRWKVVANTTDLNPGEVWPSTALVNDDEGEYYLTYFHPGDSTIKLENLAYTIQQAFDKFVFKDFEVLAKGDYLHFKSTQENRFSESAVLSFNTYKSRTVSIMDVPFLQTSGSVNFIGASNRNRTRARITKEVAHGMLADEYISTKGSFSEIRNFNVLDGTVVFSPYLEEPVYNESGKLVDFIGSDQYLVISLNEEVSEIQLTSDSKITTYELFKPSFGVLSIMPIKDFDTDYYISDYTKNYTPELIKYFARDFSPMKIIGITGSNNEIYQFDTEISLDTYPSYIPFITISDDGKDKPKLYNDIVQFRFDAPGSTATIVYSTDGNINGLVSATNTLSLSGDYSALFKTGVVVDVTDTSVTPNIVHEYPVSYSYFDGIDTQVIFDDLSVLSGSLGSYANIRRKDFLPNISQTIILMPGEKSAYFNEDKLSKFKGFYNLSSLITPQDEEQFKALENKWDPLRFSIQSIPSEYDRLSENYLKTLTLKSRVVPTSMKWVSPQGRDVRDNPYRFNYHRAFGNMNFSPTENISTPDPVYHTHEWAYLDQVPDKFDPIAHPESAFSYFFDHLNETYDFSSLKRDWFSAYFSVGYPIEKFKNSNGEYVSLDIDPIERYSYFNFDNSVDKSFTFFRGYKLLIEELDSKTGNTVTSQKYNNYKFSVIIKNEEEDHVGHQDPVEFKTIVNEKWKFIVLIITLRTSSYRFPQGKVRYADLYTLQNNNDYGYYVIDSTESLPGYFQSVPMDKKLSVSINFSNYSVDTTLSNVTNFYDSVNSNDNFIDDLTGQIVPIPNGTFTDIVGYYESEDISYKVTANFPSLSPDIEGPYDKNTIKVSGDVTNLLTTSTLSPIFTSTVSLPYASFDWEKFTFYHQMGGNNSLLDIAERMSFAEISKMINRTSLKGQMIYEIYKENGDVSYSPNFKMTTISPEELTRYFEYIPVSDDNKPSIFQNMPNIGAVLVEEKDLQKLYRYQGDYSPKFKDVLKFWLREDEDFTLVHNRDFLLCNTHLGTNLKDFSILKNQFYNKVSDTEILTLTPDSGYSPVYPLVNEIAIDKKNVFAWSSSWDQNYYRKYIDTSNFNEVKGTESMKEIKSLFGSKLMKVPEQHDLYEYSAVQVYDQIQLTNSISEFTYLVESEKITIQVNLNDRLIREMLGNNTDLKAKTEFLNTISNVESSFNIETIEDKVKDYLIQNIIDLYTIDQVKMYYLETGNSASGKISAIDTNFKKNSGSNAVLSTIADIADRPVIETIDNYTLSESELLAKGYIQKKDTTINNIGNLKFQITYNFDSRFYTSLSVGVTVKRI
jgi:hypothetical protein